MAAPAPLRDPWLMGVLPGGLAVLLAIAALPGASPAQHLAAAAAIILLHAAIALQLRRRMR